MYAGQYRNNPLIENKLELNNNYIKPTKKQKGSKSRNRKTSGVKQNHLKSQEAALERAFSDSTIDYVTQGVKKLSVGTRKKVK